MHPRQHERCNPTAFQCTKFADVCISVWIRGIGLSLERPRAVPFTTFGNLMQEARFLLRRMLSSSLLAGLLLLGGCTGADVRPVRAQGEVVAPDSFDHGRFDRLLEQYVDARGFVDYAGLKAHQDSALTPYLQQLAATDPSNLDRDERLAFWINAYNALTIKLVVDHYPVESIRDITPVPGPSIPKVNSPFKLDVGEVGGTVRTLDEIEHGIIRERFDEPRIHFALVCAAWSCPRLRREAYTGSRLDAQLADQARTFLHTARKNKIPAGESTIQLSRIFKWYQGDFGDSPAEVQHFIAPYFADPVRRKLASAAYQVEYLEYDWSLNDQASGEQGKTVSTQGR